MEGLKLAHLEVHRIESMSQDSVLTGRHSFIGLADPPNIPSSQRRVRVRFAIRQMMELLETKIFDEVSTLKTSTLLRRTQNLLM